MTLSEDQTQPDAPTAHTPSMSPGSLPIDFDKVEYSGSGLLKPGVPMSIQNYEAADQNLHQYVAPRRLQFSQSSMDTDNVSLNCEDYKSCVVEYGERAMAQARSLFIRDEPTSAYMTACKALNAVLQARSTHEETYLDLLAKFISLEKGTKSPKALVQNLKDYIESLEKQISSLTDQNEALTLQGQVSEQTAQEAMHAITSRNEEIQQLYANKQKTIAVLKETIQRLKGELASKQMLEEKLHEAEKTIASSTHFQIGSYEEINSFQYNLFDLINMKAVHRKYPTKCLQRPSPITNSEKIDKDILTTPSRSLDDKGENLYNELGGQMPLSAELSNMFENPRPAPKPASDSGPLHELPRIMPQVALVESPASLGDLEIPTVDHKLVRSERDSGGVTKTNSQTLNSLPSFNHRDTDPKASIMASSNDDTKRQMPNTSSQYSSDIIQKSQSDRRSSRLIDPPQGSSLPIEDFVDAAHDRSQSGVVAPPISSTRSQSATEVDRRAGMSSLTGKQPDGEAHVNSDHFSAQYFGDTTNPASTQTQSSKTHAMNDVHTKSPSTQLSYMLAESTSSLKNGSDDLSLRPVGDGKKQPFLVGNSSVLQTSPSRHCDTEVVNSSSDSNSSADRSQPEGGNQASSPTSTSSLTSFSSPLVDTEPKVSVRNSTDVTIQTGTKRLTGKDRTPPRSLSHGLLTPPSSKRRIRQSSVPVGSAEHDATMTLSFKRRGYRAITGTTSSGSNSNANSEISVSSGSRRTSLRTPSKSLESDSAIGADLTRDVLDHYLPHNSFKDASSSWRAMRQSGKREQGSLSSKVEASDRPHKGFFADHHPSTSAETGSESVPNAPRNDRSDRSLSGSTNVSFGGTMMSKKFEEAIYAWCENDPTYWVTDGQPARVTRKKTSLQQAGNTQIGNPISPAHGHVSQPEGSGSGSGTSSQHEIRTRSILRRIDDVESAWTNYPHGEESQEDNTEQRSRANRGSEGHSSSIELSPQDILRRRSLSATGPIMAARRSTTEKASTVRPSFRQEPRSFYIIQNDLTPRESTASYHNLLDLHVGWVRQIVVSIHTHIVTALSAASAWCRRLCEATMAFSATVTWPSMQFTGCTFDLGIWHWIHLVIVLTLLCLTYQAHSARQHWYNANTSQVREVVMGWRETQWESSVFRYLRWQLESIIERHLTGRRPMRLT